MQKRFDIKVSPNAKKISVKKDGDLLKVYTTAKAMDGKANASVIAILAKYFHVKKREIQITRGLKSRYKSITIDNLG